MDMMASAAGTGIAFLRDTIQLESQKSAVVLAIPPMQERTDTMLVDMIYCIKNADSFDGFIWYQSDVEEKEQPCWYSIPSKRNIVLNKI